MNIYFASDSRAYVVHMIDDCDDFITRYAPHGRVGGIASDNGVIYADNEHYCRAYIIYRYEEHEMKKVVEEWHEPENEFLLDRLRQYIAVTD